MYSAFSDYSIGDLINAFKVTQSKVMDFAASRNPMREFSVVGNSQLQRTLHGLGDITA